MSRADMLAIAVSVLVAGLAILLSGPFWGKVLVLLGLIGLLVWYRKREVGQNKSEGWKDIEARFHELLMEDIQSYKQNNTPPLTAWQVQDGGLQRWCVMGGTRSNQTKAERLCRMAGNKLEATNLWVSERPITGADRWFGFLVDIGEAHKTSSVDQDSRVTYSYKISELLKASIVGCIECLARETKVCDVAH